MLPTIMSSSFLLRSCPGDAIELDINVEGSDGAFQSEDVMSQVENSGTLFAEILDTCTELSSNKSVDMSSESDEDMLDFLVSKKLLKGKKRKESEIRTDDDDIGEQKKTKCMNKNAVSARLQRERKKEYVQKLEKKVKELDTENQHMKSQLSDNSNRIDSMKTEIQYLKSVIANHTNLAALLNKIPVSNGMQLSSSIAPLVGNGRCCNNNQPLRRSRDDGDNSLKDITSSTGVYVVTTGKVPKVRTSESLLRPRNTDPKSNVDGSSTESESTTPGVCLHVSQNKVSLEFCAACASNAAKFIPANGAENKRTRKRGQKMKAA